MTRLGCRAGLAAVADSLLLVGLALGVGSLLFVGTAAAATGASGPPTGFTMDRFLTHWWVFPAAVLFSTVALAAGVSGALVHALSATPVWYVVAWSIPGVPLGGTVGTRVGKYLPSDLMEVGLGVVFAVVGLVVFGVELLA